jgi:hypothetical protein
VNKLAEYNTLREEIGRHQDQSTRSLEVGILITSGVLTVSYSSIISSEYQWMVILSPAFLLIPFIYLIIERVRITWFIGRYIELHLEPELGYHWEGFNRKMRGSSKGPFRSRFTRSSVIPLIGLQVVSPVLALLVGVPDFRLWLGLMGVVLVVVILELRWSSRFMIDEDALDVMRAEIENLSANQSNPDQYKTVK